MGGKTVFFVRVFSIVTFIHTGSANRFWAATRNTDTHSFKTDKKLLSKTDALERFTCKPYTGRHPYIIVASRRTQIHIKREARPIQLQEKKPLIPTFTHIPGVSCLQGVN